MAGINLTGNTGDNLLTGSASTNTLGGGDGNDTLAGLGGNDTLNGNAGDDRLDGGTGNDLYRLQEEFGGNDVISDGGGTDIIEWEDFGGDTFIDLYRDGADLVINTVNSDGLAFQTATIIDQFAGAGTFIETLQTKASPGNPSVAFSFVTGMTGTEGNNFIVGTSGGDIILGLGGSDMMYGGLGNDNIDGGAGDEEIHGGAGNDTVNGGAGDDALVGGAGTDLLVGGLGNDVFDFDGLSELGLGATSDVISGWNAGDQIDLTTIDWNTALAGDQAFTFVGAGAFTATAGQVRYSGGVLQFNTDTDTAAEYEILITGTPPASLTAGADLLL